MAPKSQQSAPLLGVGCPANTEALPSDWVPRPGRAPYRLHKQVERHPWSRQAGHGSARCRGSELELHTHHIDRPPCTGTAPICVTVALALKASRLAPRPAAGVFAVAGYIAPGLCGRVPCRRDVPGAQQGPGTGATREHRPVLEPTRIFPIWMPCHRPGSVVLQYDRIDDGGGPIPMASSLASSHQRDRQHPPAGSLGLTASDWLVLKLPAANWAAAMQRKEPVRIARPTHAQRHQADLQSRGPHRHGWQQCEGQQPVALPCRDPKP